MKINKILIIALAIVLIVGIIAGVVYFTTRNDDADKDPTDEFIENNNYPFNGIYGDDVSIVTEEQIKQALEEDATITEYAKDITVEISKDQIVNLSCSLENAENLCTFAAPRRCYESVWLPEQRNQRYFSDTSFRFGCRSKNGLGAFERI